MTWPIAGALIWILISIGVALGIGRAIRTANQKEGAS